MNSELYRLAKGNSLLFVLMVLKDGSLSLTHIKQALPHRATPPLQPSPRALLKERIVGVWRFRRRVATSGSLSTFSSPLKHNSSGSRGQESKERRRQLLQVESGIKAFQLLLLHPHLSKISTIQEDNKSFTNQSKSRSLKPLLDTMQGYIYCRL